MLGMCTHAGAHGRVCVCVQDHGLTAGVFLHHSSHVLRQHLLLNLELSNLARVAGQQAHGILLPLST